MTLRGQVTTRDRFALLDGWQQFVTIGKFRLRIVRSFNIGTQKTGEFNRLSRDLKYGICPGNGDARAVATRVDHLACNGAFPYQLEQPELAGIKFAPHRFGQAKWMSGGPDRFVRFPVRFLTLDR